MPSSSSTVFGKSDDDLEKRINSKATNKSTFCFRYKCIGEYIIVTIELQNHFCTQFWGWKLLAILSIFKSIDVLLILLLKDWLSSPIAKNHMVKISIHTMTSTTSLEYIIPYDFSLDRSACLLCRIFPSVYGGVTRMLTLDMLSS